LDRASSDLSGEAKFAVRTCVTAKSCFRGAILRDYTACMRTRLAESEQKRRGGVRGRSWEAGAAFAALDKFGIDAICEMITSGQSLVAIAEDLGVSKNALFRWLAHDLDRSARAKAARAAAALAWDEEAAEAIRSAKDLLELGKARELAQHLRWRAAKANPRQFGDRVNLDHGGSITLEALVTQSLKPLPQPE